MAAGSGRAAGAGLSRRRGLIACRLAVAIYRVVSFRIEGTPAMRLMILDERLGASDAVRSPIQPIVPYATSITLVPAHLADDVHSVSPRTALQRRGRPLQGNGEVSR